MCVCECVCVPVLEDACKPMSITVADKTPAFPLPWALLHVGVCSVTIPEDLAAYVVSEWSLQFVIQDLCSESHHCLSKAQEVGRLGGSVG